MSSLAATLRRESGAEVEYLRTRVEHLEAENRELKAALAAARADAAAAQLSHGVAMPRPGSSRSFRSAGSRPSPRPPVHPIDEDRPSPIHAGSSKLREDGGDSPPATMRAVGGYRPSTASTDGSDGQKEEGMCMNCDTAVPLRNMQNHQLHCYRNVFKCPMCQEPVMVKERQEHVRREKGTVAMLAEACVQDKLGLLSRMLAHGADVNEAVNDDGDTPLHLASRAGRLLVLQFLLSKGAEIDKPNVHGSTPLHVACAEKKLFEVSAYLLSQGASTECRNAMGDGALEIAQRHHNTEIAILISRHASRPGSSHSRHSAGALRPRSSHRSRPSNRPQGPAPSVNGVRRPSVRGRRPSRQTVLGQAAAASPRGSSSGVQHTMRSISPILS